MHLNKCYQKKKICTCPSSIHLPSAQPGRSSVVDSPIMYFHTRYLADFLHMHNSLVKTLKMRPFKTRIYLLDKNYLMKKFLKYSQPRCHACFQHISPLAPADFSEKMMRMMTVDSKMYNDNILMTQVGSPFQHLR